MPIKGFASVLVSNVDKLTSEGELPVRLCNYTDVYKNEFITPALNLMHASATTDEISRFRLQTNDVVITKDSESWDDIAVPALVIDTSDDLVCGYHLAIIRPEQSRIRGRYLFRCLQARSVRLQLELAATGITRFGLSRTDITQLVVPLPPTDVQDIITDHLDIEISQIDEMITEKAHMLALIEEKRAALVSRAVTRGLDDNVLTKDSTLVWLGDIPAHWTVIRLKHFAQIGNGSTPSREKSEYWVGGDYPWFNSAVVNARRVEQASRYVTVLALEECHLPKVSPPALLVAITGQGKTRGKTTILDFEATINQHLAYVKPRGHAAHVVYLSFLLDSAYLYLRSDSDGAGSTRGAITCEQLASFRIALPPYDEQERIISFITSETARFTELEEDLRRSISLLAERRIGLITAAVTGQLPLDAHGV